MKNKKIKSLKASGIVESVIAMVIIISVFGIAMLIMIHMNKSMNTRLLLRAYMVMDKILYDTRENKTYFDENIRDEGIYIEKTITAYNGQDNLYIISLVAKNTKGKEIAVTKELLKINDR